MESLQSRWRSRKGMGMGSVLGEFFMDLVKLEAFVSVPRGGLFDGS
jgi:hypothetical protein